MGMSAISGPRSPTKHTLPPGKLLPVKWISSCDIMLSAPTCKANPIQAELLHKQNREQHCGSQAPARVRHAQDMAVLSELTELSMQCCLPRSHRLWMMWSGTDALTSVSRERWAINLGACSLSRRLPDRAVSSSLSSLSDPTL